MSKDLVIIPKDYKKNIQDLIDAYNHNAEDSDEISGLLSDAIGILGDLLAESE
jgi:hypothetical protein